MQMKYGGPSTMPQVGKPNLPTRPKQVKDEPPELLWPHVHEKVIRWCAKRACELFGSSTQFNAANFAQAWREATGMTRVLDGGLVSAMLCGRSWVWQDPHSTSHWRMLDE